MIMSLKLALPLQAQNQENCLIRLKAKVGVFVSRINERHSSINTSQLRLKTYQSSLVNYNDDLLPRLRLVLSFSTTK